MPFLCLVAKKWRKKRRQQCATKSQGFSDRGARVRIFSVCEHGFKKAVLTLICYPCLPRVLTTLKHRTKDIYVYLLMIRAARHG
jgi:hypothetical protein